MSACVIDRMVILQYETGQLITFELSHAANWMNLAGDTHKISVVFLLGCWYWDIMVYLFITLENIYAE